MGERWSSPYTVPRQQAHSLEAQGRPQAPSAAVVEVEAAAGLPGAQGGPVVRRGSSAWGSCTGCGGCGRAAMCQELRHGGERERRLQPPHAQTPEGLGGRPTPLPPPQQAGPLTLSHGFLPAEDSGANQSQRPGHGTHREYRQSCDVFAASPPRPREHPLLLNVTQLGQGSAAGARSARLPRLPWGRRARPIAAAPQVLRAQLVAAPPQVALPSVVPAGPGPPLVLQPTPQRGPDVSPDPVP